MSDAKDIHLTAKQVVGFLVSLATCMVGAATIHSVLVVPAIMTRVHDMIDEELVRHSSRTHPSGASREDVRDIVVRLDTLATRNDIEHVLERISSLSDRVKRLENGK